MICQMMAVKHDPPATYGDCYRACLASIIEVATTDVPHPGVNGEAEWHNEIKVLDSWLAERRLWTFGMKILDKDLRDYQEYCHGYYLLGGLSPRGTPHFVVARNCSVVHDPHPDGGGIVADPDGTWNLQFLCYGARRKLPMPVRSITVLRDDQRDAARYRWLRAGNAYFPEEQHVRGGVELDELCDWEMPDD